MCIRRSDIVRAAMAAVLWCAAVQAYAAAPAKAAPVTLANDYVRYLIGADGLNVGFLDKRTGKEYLAGTNRRPFALLKAAGKLHAPTGCSYKNGRLALQFGKTHTAAVKVTIRSTTSFSSWPAWSGRGSRSWCW